MALEVQVTVQVPSRYFSPCDPSLCQGVIEATSLAFLLEASLTLFQSFNRSWSGNGAVLGEGGFK